MSRIDIISLLHELTARWEADDNIIVSDEAAKALLNVEDQESRNSEIAKMVKSGNGYVASDVLRSMFEMDPDTVPSFQSILAKATHSNGIDSFGRLVDFYLREAKAPIGEVADWLISSIKCASDEEAINSISYGLWIIYCGAWAGVQTNWKVTQFKSPGRIRELESLMKLDQLTEYARGSIAECLKSTKTARHQQ